MLKKILLAILAVITLPLASLWYTDLYELPNDLKKEVNQELTLTADRIATKVDDWTDTSRKLLKQNSSLSQMVSGVGSAQKPILQAIVETYDRVNYAYALNSDGYVTASSDDKVIGADTFDGSDHSYFRKIKTGSEFAQQLEIDSTLKKPVFIQCHSLGEPGQRASKMGALCISSTIDELSHTVVETKFGETGYAVLLDEFSNVVAHGNEETPETEIRNMASDPMVVRAKVGAPYSYYHGETHKVAYMEDLDHDWRLIVEQDYDDAYVAISQAQQRTLVILLATLVATLLTAFILARFLTAPIQRLTAIANDIRMGKFDNELTETSRTDEIGELARAIEKMSISISMSLKQLGK